MCILYHQHHPTTYHRYSAHHILGEMELLNRLGFADDDKDSEHTAAGIASGSTGRRKIRSNLFLKPHPPVILNPSPNHSGGEGEAPLQTIAPRNASGLRNASLPRNPLHNDNKINNANNSSNSNHAAASGGSARNVSPLISTPPFEGNTSSGPLKVGHRIEALSVGTLALSLTEGGQSSCQSESEPILLSRNTGSNNPSILSSSADTTTAGAGGMHGGHETVMNVIYQRAASRSDDEIDHYHA